MGGIILILEESLDLKIFKNHTFIKPPGYFFHELCLGI